MSLGIVRMIPMDFKQEEGAELYEGVYLGKLLGAGSQAKVFRLVDKDGNSLGKVLKIGHTDLGHTMILNKFASSMMDLQHEWELGIRIMNVLADSDGSLPGYTRTYDGCVSKNEKTGKVIFRGMILEQINGYPVRKRLSDPTFHNIHYVKEMLFQLLTALDKGQRALGFTHADMGLGNVMEHYPESWPEGKVKSGADIPGFIESGSGDPLPLGPKVEFKIIDYGLVEFNDLLAYTAGGVKPVDVVAQAEEKLRKELPDLEDVDGLQFGPEPDEAGKTEACSWTLQKEKGKSTKGSRFHAKRKGQPEKKSPVEMINLNGARGPVEKMYRLFWARKGDLFHLLLALGTILNERVWPRRDEKDVRMFASLVYHVTGVTMTAYFAEPEDPRSPKVMGRRNKGEKITDIALTEDDEEMYGRKRGFFGCFGRTHMMHKAHVRPFNSGLLAGEALVSPFFGDGGPPHAAPVADIFNVFYKTE